MDSVIWRNPPAEDIQPLRDGVPRAVTSGNEREAIAQALKLIRNPMVTPPELVELTALGRKLFSPELALGAFRRLYELDPGNLATLLNLANLEQQFCRNKAAVEHLSKAAPRCTTVDDYLRLGLVYDRMGEVESAKAQFEKALRLDPRNPHVRFNLAVCHGFLGEIDEADTIYSDLIAQNFKRDLCCQNRSWLRKQTPNRNHIEQLRGFIDGSPQKSETAHHLFFALARELDDLGSGKEAFECYAAAASAKRATLSDYDPAAEDKRVSEQIKNFNSGFLAEPRQGHASEEPIFVVSLPRAGSTLVERILGRHTAVFAAGEIDNFLRLADFAAARIARDKGVSDPYYPHWYAKLDFEALGKEYVDSTRPRTGHTPCFVDKLPTNYNLIGLIACALPDAKIVHVHRNPMDVCFAMYRQFFDQSHSYTYDLKDLGQVYLAYRRLMDHWDAVLPGKVIHVAYEELVMETESVTRDLLDRLGLPWEDACLDPAAQSGPSKSASSIQVRRPVYQSSVGRWRQFEKELAPLREMLEAGGIKID